jgi:lipopolysaccharide export system ATP-binding protein
VVGLLGPSGSGKTTLFRLISGVISPDRGVIRLDDRDVTALPLYERARRGLSYLPQEPSVFRGLTVEQNVLLALESYEPASRRAPVLAGLLAELGIEHVRRTRADWLSGGERRRCEIARALASRPSFILLDEPFAGVDPIGVQDVRSLLRSLTRREIGVLITDHNVRETLGLVDRAYIIDAGRMLMHGVPADIVANPDVRHVYLGPDFML